jgi:FAD/FMN-containing dehydrogenase
MILKPQTVSEHSAQLGCANAQGHKVAEVDLSSLSRVLEHKAEDMTATVEAGTTLGRFQKELEKRGQWLPLDPPHTDKLTIHDLLAFNRSGPRRFGYGTAGDFVIGLKAVLSDGRVISPGGKVVKNVAGYDLAKLFIGGQGSLGVIVEATFKLRPIPESEQFVQRTFGSLAQVDSWIKTILDSSLTPVVFDLTPRAMILGFAGTKEEVAWQMATAAKLGFNEASSLAYVEEFWNGSPAPQKISVLPSQTVSIVARLNGEPFVARLGNGIIYHRTDLKLSSDLAPRKLASRLKQEFDPRNILPEMKP